MTQKSKVLSTKNQQDFEDELFSNEENDDDIDLFSKFNKIDKIIDSTDSDDNDSRNKNAKNLTIETSNNKIIIKKHNAKSNKSSPGKSILFEANNFETGLSNNLNNNNFSSMRESMSLSDNLREVKDENGRLRKVLAEKEYEINYLKKKIDEEKSNFANLPIGNDVAATKIVDLSKKVRELTSQLESEKTKNKQLQRKNKDLETKLATKNDAKNDTESEKDEDQDENQDPIKKVSLTKENRDLKENLYQTSHKLLELKSQNEILKQEVKKMQKVLEKECGENCDLKSILSGNSSSNWRGRQQQIRMLQTKVNELKQQLSNSQYADQSCRASQLIMLGDHQDNYENDNLETNNFMRANVNSVSSLQQPRSAAQMSVLSGYSTAITNSGSVRNLENFRNRAKFERDKREQFEKMKQEFESMENELNSTKEKLEAAKARNKILTNENKTFKEQVKTLLEKGKHDDELVDALMKKQNQLKQILEEMNYEKDKVNKDLEEKSKEISIKSMQEKNTIEQMRAIILEKENRIKQLEFELKEKPIIENNEKIMPRVTNQKQVSFVANEIDTIGKSDSRASSGAIQKRPNSSSILTQAKMAIEDKKDYKLECTELKTLYKTSEIERIRLMDLVKTLQKRIEELNEKSIENENKLNEQRRKCANLEKQIEKLKLLQNKSNNNSNNNQSKTSTNNNNSSMQMDQYKIDELETSLLIQKDENDALKAALKSTLEAKEEDLRLYVEMLESTKRVYLDGLKQYKSIATNEA